MWTSQFFSVSKIIVAASSIVCGTTKYFLKLTSYKHHNIGRHRNLPGGREETIDWKRLRRNADVGTGVKSMNK
jgi:hypothetical protein